MGSHRCKAGRLARIEAWIKTNCVQSLCIVPCSQLMSPYRRMGQGCARMHCSIVGPCSQPTASSEVVGQGSVVSSCAHPAANPRADFSWGARIKTAHFLSGQSVHPYNTHPVANSCAGIDTWGRGVAMFHAKSRNQPIASFKLWGGAYLLLVRILQPTHGSFTVHGAGTHRCGNPMVFPCEQ